MGCLFCKKLERGSKEDDGLEGNFRASGTANRYSPDPTQGRPASSFTHIPNYNSFSPQPTSHTFLGGSNVKGISGEWRRWWLGSWEQVLPGHWQTLGGQRGETWT